MSYLHSKEIVHRSLKTASVYLDEILFPKIGDFGFSSNLFNPDSFGSQSIAGLIIDDERYAAPEVLKFGTYMKSSDIYSFSLNVYEIMTNEVPFGELNNGNLIYDEVVEKKNRPQFQKEVPESYLKLIEKCWSMNPDDKPTFDEIVENLKNDSGFLLKKGTMKVIKNT